MTNYIVAVLDWTKMTRDERGDLYGGPQARNRAVRRALLNEAIAGTYKLDAESLDEVFEILNIRHPADYKMRSLSVGDVIMDEQAQEWIVAPMGFEALAGVKS